MDSQTIFEWSPRTGTKLSWQVLSSDPENTNSLSVSFNCDVPIELFLSADVIPKYEWTLSMSAAADHPLAICSSLSKARQKRTFWIPKKDDKSLRKVMSSGILECFPFSRPIKQSKYVVQARQYGLFLFQICFDFETDCSKLSSFRYCGRLA